MVITPTDSLVALLSPAHIEHRTSHHDVTEWQAKFYEHLSYTLGALLEITYPSPDPNVCDGALASYPTPHSPLTTIFFPIPAVSLPQLPYPLPPNHFPAVTLPSISSLLPPPAFMPLLPHSRS